MIETLDVAQETRPGPRRRFRMRHAVALFLLVAVAGGVLLLARRRPPAEAEVLALVGGRPVTAADFRAYIGRLPDFYRPYAKANRSQVLRDFIDREIIYRAARRARFDRQPAVRERLESLRREVLVQAYVQHLISEETAYPREQLRLYYLNNLEQFVQPESVHLHEILVAGHREAESVRERLRAGESFAELARSVSLAPSRSRGGDLGFVKRGVLPAALEEAAFSLDVEQLSEPVSTDTGWYILRVRARLPERQLDFEEALPEVRRIMVSVREEDVYNRLVRDLRRGVRVEIREENLDAMSF